MGIEIASSSHSEPSQSQAHGRGAAKAQGVAWGATVSTGSSSSSASVAPSFRDGWQSLLASLNANGSSLIQQAPARDGMQAQAESAFAGSPGKAAQLPSSTAEVPTLTLISPGTQPDKPALAATQSPLVSAPAAIPAWVTVTATPLPVAPKSIVSGPAAGEPGGSLSTNHATSSEHGAKHKAAPALGGRPLVIATAGSTPQTVVPAQSTGAPVESAAQPAPSLPPASLAIAAPTAPVFDSINANSQHAADREAPADSFSPAVLQTSAVEREVVIAHGLPPVGFNEAVTSTAGAEVHAPNIATGSPDEHSSPQYDLHVSADKATGAASPAEDTGAQTAGLSLAHSTGFDSNQAVQGAAEAGLQAPHIATGSPDEHSSPQYDLHVAADKVTEAASPAEDTGTQTSGLSLAHSAGFDSNQAVQGAAEAGSHIATGSPDAHSSPQYDLHVSAENETEAATDKGSTQSGVATRAGEAHSANPAGSIGSAEVTGKAGDLAADTAGSATARSFYPGSRSSTAVPGLASSRQVAIGGGIPAPPVGTSLNPLTNPSVPVRASRANEPLSPTNLVASTGTQSGTASDAAQSSSPMRSQVKESLQSSPQAGTPMQPRPVGQGVEAVASPIAADGLSQTLTLQAAAPLQSAQLAPTPPVVGKTDMSTGAGAQSGSRSQRSARAVSTVAQGNSQASGQIAVQSTDSSPQMRDLASANVSTSLAAGAATGSAGSATSPSAHETFAALDGGTATASPTWTHAGTQYAEAGFHDPDLGWVGVRADSAGGGVHASLIPDSAGAAQTLGGHVAGLNTYLAEQHTPVETLSVAAPENHSMAPGADQSAGQGMQQGAGQNPGQGGYSEAASISRQNAPAINAAPSSVEAASAVGQDASAPAIGLGGLHISVMA